MAVTFANYTLALTGLAPGFRFPLAVGAILLLSGVNYFGVRPGALTQNVFTVLKLLALAVLVGAGLLLTSPQPAVVEAIAARQAPDSIVLAMGAALVPVLFSYGPSSSRARARMANCSTTSSSPTGSSSAPRPRRCSSTARERKGLVPRAAYRVPGHPFTPLLFIAAALYVLLGSAASNPLNALKGTLLLGAGVPVFLYWRRRTRREAAPSALGAP
ncbi:hypothetical protein [Corallococcus sicarius]|uniref:Amino acid permease n=1 Tax=Corallococcus sicarius TaxID=2316726 RepID=A0A3A8NLJ2_9BACT|nr:hypothetical protein [Corallococcus sicarius]RKH40842.1 hypothetical protein D7X12_19695 [Corallococcus sicarius]